MQIGTIVIGRIQKHNNQFIGTKFVIVGIPLFPTKSIFFINDEQGIEMNSLHGKSVLKGYASFYCLILGFLGFLFGGLPGIPFIAASIYFFWFFEKPTDEEKKERNLFEKTTGVNALPSFLDAGAAQTLRNGIVQKIRIYEPTLTAETIAQGIESGEYDEKHLALLFPFIAYHNRVVGGGKYDHLVEKIKREYIDYSTQGSKTPTSIDNLRI